MPSLRECSTSSFEDTIRCLESSQHSECAGAAARALVFARELKVILTDIWVELHESEGLFASRGDVMQILLLGFGGLLVIMMFLLVAGIGIAGVEKTKKLTFNNKFVQMLMQKKIEEERSEKGDEHSINTPLRVNENQAFE